MTPVQIPAVCKGLSSRAEYKGFLHDVSKSVAQAAI